MYGCRRALDHHDFATAEPARTSGNVLLPTDVPGLAFVE